MGGTTWVNSLSLVGHPTAWARCPPYSNDLATRKPISSWRWAGFSEKRCTVCAGMYGMREYVAWFSKNISKHYLAFKRSRVGICGARRHDHQISILGYHHLRKSIRIDTVLRSHTFLVLICKRGRSHVAGGGLKVIVPQSVHRL